MYCSKCGTELPDEANFCWKCGKPQGANVPQAAPKYERCEIVWDCVKRHILSLDDLKFWAKAIGENGTYNAGESEIFQCLKAKGPESENKMHVNAHNGLVKKLVSAGWEATGERGGEWFSIRFKRLIK